VSIAPTRRPGRCGHQSAEHIVYVQVFAAAPADFIAHPSAHLDGCAARALGHGFLVALVEKAVVEERSADS